MSSSPRFPLSCIGICNMSYRDLATLATVIEYYEGAPGQEPGYELEVFNAVGDTFAVVTARESQIESLRKDELLSVRPQKLALA